MMTSKASITSFETLKKKLLLCIAMGYGFSGMAEPSVVLPAVPMPGNLKPKTATPEEIEAKKAAKQAEEAAKREKEKAAAALREKKEAEKKANQSRADLDNKNAEIARLKAELARTQKRPPTPDQPTATAPISIAPPPTPATEIIDNRYQILANGAEVKDLQTNLIWQRCQVGMNWNGNTCTGESKKFTFDDAEKQAGNGWRVPTIRELLSLIYCSSGKMQHSNNVGDGGAPIKHWCDGEYTRPTINTKAFPNTPSDRVFWSSSTYVAGSAHAWVVSFYSGGAHGYGGRDYGDGAVRLVR